MENVKVLVVDDEEGVREVLNLALSPYWRVIEASNGKEALEKYCSEELALIITDMSMPAMSGLELIRGIRATDKKIPILAISGVNSQLALANEAGADASLLKPFRIEQLINIINDLITPNESEKP